MSPAHPRKLRAALLATVATVFASPLAAQEPGDGAAPAPTQERRTFSMDAVTATADRTEKRPVDAMAPVSIVGSEEIDRIQADDLDDILRSVPGVTTGSSSDHPGTRINIRGLEDWGRVNVMIDGARQNYQRSGHGQKTMVFLDPETVKQVDVVRGPNATIYGSGAIGGVVSFQTKDAADILRPGQIAGGMISQAHQSVDHRNVTSVSAYALPTEWLDVFVSGSFARGGWYEAGGDEGKVANTDTDRWSGLGKVTLTPREDHELRLSALRNRNDFRTGTDPFLDDQEFTDDTFSGTYRWTPDAHWWADLTITGYYTTTEQTETRLTGGDEGRVTAVEIETPGVDVFNTARFTTGALDHALTIGFDYFRDDVTASRGNGPLEFTPSGERRIWGAYIQNEMTLFEDFEITGALRYDDYDMEGGDIANSDITNSDTALSPRVALGWSPLPWGQVYGSWSRAFRAPAITESLISGVHPPPANFQFIPNPTLRPETAENWEGGVNLEFDELARENDALRVKVNYFRNTVDDFIGTFFNQAFQDVFVPFPPPGQFIQVPDFANSTFGYLNEEQVRLRGWELEATYDSDVVFASVAATAIRAKNTVTGERLISTPANRAVVTVGLRNQHLGLEGGWRVTAVGGLEDKVDETQNPASAYTLHDVFLTWQPGALNDAFRFDLAIENLLDEAYRTRFAADPAQPGRNFKTRVRVRF